MTPIPGTDLFRPAIEGKRLRHQFLVMTKPELTKSLSGNTSELSEFIFRHLHDAGVAVHAVRSVKGATATHIVPRLYPRLGLVARYGATWASGLAKTKIVEFSDQDARVLSASEFLEASNWTKSKLQIEADKTGCRKFGNGVYGFISDSSAGPVLVLNPFVPEYFSRFDEDVEVMAMECSSDREWPDIRANVIGGIVPSNANAGSLRNELWTHQADFELNGISLSSNGVHISPGPLEAVWQLALIFGFDQRSLLSPALKARAICHSRKGWTLKLLDLFEDTEDVSVDVAKKMLEHKFSARVDACEAL